MIALEQLKAIMPHAGPRAAAFVAPLNDAMDEFRIDTPARQAAFLAQIAHESGDLRYTCEIASGERYEGRRDLGNTQPGDGVRYKGRGLIQITGRDNYRACSVGLYGYADRLLSAPELLEQIGPACRSAAWFWDDHGLSELADTGSFKTITRIINGGFNGLHERLAAWQRAKEVLA